MVDLRVSKIDDREAITLKLVFNVLLINLPGVSAYIYLTD